LSGLEFVGGRRPSNISASNAGRIAIRPYNSHGSV